MALEARPCPSAHQCPHHCGDPPAPQGLDPVVSGKNLGELCSLSSPDLGYWVGPWTVENHMWFLSIRNPEDCSASCMDG